MGASYVIPVFAGLELSATRRTFTPLDVSARLAV